MKEFVSPKAQLNSGTWPKINIKRIYIYFTPNYLVCKKADKPAKNEIKQARILKEFVSPKAQLNSGTWPKINIKRIYIYFTPNYLVCKKADKPAKNEIKQARILKEFVSPKAQLNC